MKKNLLFILLLFSGLNILAQNGFDKKKKTSSGEKVTGDFQVISGKNARKKSISGFSVSTQDITKKVIKDEDSDAVIYLSNKSFSRGMKKARKSFAESGNEFFKAHKNDLKIDNPALEFLKIEETTDEIGRNHLKYQQRFKGVNIYGGESMVHTNELGYAEFLTGKVYPTPKINTIAQIDAKSAIAACYQDLGKTTIIQNKGLVGGLLKTETEQSELVIIPEGGKEFLAYHITVRPNMLERWVYFIDANTGKVLDKYNHTCSLDGVVNASAKDLNGVTQAFKAVQVGGVNYMIDPTKSMYKSTQSKLPDDPIGTIWTINAQNSKVDADELNLAHVTSNSATSWNATAVSAHINASKCYDYFLAKFGRNSLNGNGGNIISVINIADEDGKGMDNAYWNGQFMGYGNGRDAFKPLAGALDVAGHEMTHGVVENTAKLEYRNQSGALNESFADIFGALIDTKNWTMGEDVVIKSQFPSGALRSLENPNQGGKNDPGYQPKTMSQYEYLRDTPSEDNGGVHVNSGIPNYAFYKFATASGMSREKAEKVYYRALTNYLTRTSKFTDLRIAVLQATKDLYGQAGEYNAAAAAFDAVGITDPNASGGTGGGGSGSSGSGQTTIPVNPGTEKIVVLDPISGDLYATALNENLPPVIVKNLGSQGKPSITDDGSFVYFVGNDKHIYRKSLTTNAAVQKLSENASWRNVAISKDGKLLAALASELEPVIYIYDLVNGKNAKFELYNPTYSKGVSSGEVQYADGLEWDYSGEYLVYDAFNAAKSNFKTIEFWDVGILNAWDAVGKTFGDGTIEKLFTNLEEGDNIGNPALAKTNTGIMAFDYFLEDEDTYYVLTIDFGKSGENIGIVENNNIGYPDFNKSDKMLVFNAYDGDTEVISTVNLDTDKITPTSEAEVRFKDAKWGIWFASGTRALPTKEAQTITIAAIPDKQPKASFDISASASSNLGLIYTVVKGDASISGKRVTLGSTPGKVTIKAIQDGTTKYAPATAEASFCIIPPAPKLTDNGQTVVASGGTLYQFYVNNNPIGGQTSTATFKKDFGGTYTVKTVTTDGCVSATSNALTVVALASEPQQELSVMISPNPSYENVKIDIPLGETLKKIEVMDSKGLKVKTSDSQLVNVSDLATGQYMFKVETDKTSRTVKIIKN
ncbi:MAG: M4 family metallopeptidase [Bacteroidetes bacterium]|nr:M4 family metallopeptidase [Bacteroidota bacterium]